VRRQWGAVDSGAGLRQEVVMHRSSLHRRPSRGRPSPGLVLASLVLLAGCAGLPGLRRDPAPTAAAPDVGVTVDPGPEVVRPLRRAGPDPAGAAPRPLAPRGRTAEALDTTTPAERAAAAAAARAAEGRALGETLAGLGSPAEPGFWLLTGLTDRVRPGRVTTAAGTALAVELRPSGGPAGAGSLLSLAAIRALGLPLTELAMVQVFALD